MVESKTLKQDKSKYKTRVTFENSIDDVSPTLQHLMSLVAKKLDSTLPSAMIGNVVTSMVTNTYTSLQIALGITVRQKSVIECLRKFGVTASYVEILRFKASAVHAAARIQELMGIRPGSEGLVQSVADNFDENISSQNGLQSTHALAILLTQPQKEQNDEKTYIRRIRKEKMSQEVLPDIPVQQYRGPSKPEMPYSVSTKSPLLLKVLANQIMSASRAKEIDFLFLKTVVTEAISCCCQCHMGISIPVPELYPLMNFAGAVGVLMSDTGLETILQAAFGGVSIMLFGKKFPQNIRALRLLTEELL